MTLNKVATISDPYPLVSNITFKGGRYFKIVHTFQDVVELTSIHSKIGRVLIDHHVESNLPIKEFTALQYWTRGLCKGPLPKTIKHLFNGEL